MSSKLVIIKLFVFFLEICSEWVLMDRAQHQARCLQFQAAQWKYTCGITKKSRGEAKRKTTGPLSKWEWRLKQGPCLKCGACYQCVANCRVTIPEKKKGPWKGTLGRGKTGKSTSAAAEDTFGEIRKVLSIPASYKSKRYIKIHIKAVLNRTCHFFIATVQLIFYGDFFPLVYLDSNNIINNKRNLLWNGTRYGMIYHSTIKNL